MSSRRKTSRAHQQAKAAGVPSRGSARPAGTCSRSPASGRFGSASSAALRSLASGLYGGFAAITPRRWLHRIAPSPARFCKRATERLVAHQTGNNSSATRRYAGAERSLVGRADADDAQRLARRQHHHIGTLRCAAGGAAVAVAGPGPLRAEPRAREWPGMGCRLGAAAGLTLTTPAASPRPTGRVQERRTVAVAGAAGAGVIALTAVLHDPESLARLRLRHSSASLPPGVTPEQFAMKSERQEARIAAI